MLQVAVAKTAGSKPPGERRTWRFHRHVARDVRDAPGPDRSCDPIDVGLISSGLAVDDVVSPKTCCTVAMSGNGTIPKPKAQLVYDGAN